MAVKDEPLAKQAESIEESAVQLERSATAVEQSADRNMVLAADRTVLAAERTYAAWVRTGLAALASGAGAKALLGGFLPNLSGSLIATGARRESAGEDTQERPHRSAHRRSDQGQAAASERSLEATESRVGRAAARADADRPKGVLGLRELGTRKRSSTSKLLTPGTLN
jgi:hypothetical protein